MRPAVVSTSGVSVSAPVVLDYIQAPSSTSLAAVVTGTATYTIQHTFDDVFAPTFNPAAATWFNHDDANMVNATTNQNGNYAFPARACRINQTVGAGSVVLTVLQGLSA